MQIIMAQERCDVLIAELLNIWELSVSATHHFLTSTDIASLKPLVASILKKIPVLMYGECDGIPCGFMGIDSDKVEMLFLHPHQRGQGHGRAFMQCALQRGVSLVDVNEDNAEARAFYERMGFIVFQRSERDGQGNPFPILHMKQL